MQTIEEGAKLVIRDTMRWINQNKDLKPGWAVLNFPGVFLFHCSHLKRTRELSHWGSQRFMKAKWLYHDFDGKSLTTIKFQYPDAFDIKISETNKWLQHHLSNPTYWDAQEWKPEVTVLPRILTPQPKFGTFPALETFNFKSKEEKILVTNI